MAQAESSVSDVHVSDARGGTINLMASSRKSWRITVGLLSNNLCDLIATADFPLSASGTPASTTDVARFHRFFAVSIVEILTEIRRFYGFNLLVQLGCCANLFSSTSGGWR